MNHHFEVLCEINKGGETRSICIVPQANTLEGLNSRDENLRLMESLSLLFVCRVCKEEKGFKRILGVVIIWCNLGHNFA